MKPEQGGWRVAAEAAALCRQGERGIEGEGWTARLSNAVLSIHQVVEHCPSLAPPAPGRSRMGVGKEGKSAGREIGPSPYFSSMTWWRCDAATFCCRCCRLLLLSTAKDLKLPDYTGRRAWEHEIREMRHRKAQEVMEWKYSLSNVKV